MNKLLISVIGLLVAIIMAIAGWWVNRVNGSMEITQQLQFRSIYLNGDVPNAPVAPIGKKP